MVYIAAGSVTIHDFTPILSSAEQPKLESVEQKLVESHAYEELLNKYRKLESTYAASSEARELQKIIDKFTPLQIQALAQQGNLCCSLFAVPLPRKSRPKMA